MSRLTLPFMSQDQACFCCPPPAASTLPSHGQHTSQAHFMSPADTLGKQDHAHANLTAVSNEQTSDPNCLNALLQNIHLNCQSEMSGKESSISFPLPKNEASPVETEPYSPRGIFHLEGVDMRMSFKAIQSRQFGTKSCQRSYLSTSAPSVGSTDMNEKASAVTSDMELDQALDELGMLSTVTQSRRSFLLEMRGNASAMKRDRRLRSKSESSPNLLSLSRLNGYRIVQLDTNYVTDIFNTSPPSGIPHQPSSFSSCQFTSSPMKSQLTRMEYRNPDVLEASTLARRRRSVPRMSRLRTARYCRSRCPYKVPNRLCNSMQESDFDLDDLASCGNNLFSSSTTSLPEAAREPSVAASVSGQFPEQANLVTSSPSQSKSNTNSPVKPCQEPGLVRSLSVEDLHSVPFRKLALLFDVQNQSKKQEEQQVHLEQIASQFTDLHMS